MLDLATYFFAAIAFFLLIVLIYLVIQGNKGVYKK